MKRITLPDIETMVHDGMTIGIGGWGSRRKPLSLVSAIVRSGARNLNIVSFGGPDVGILCATGQAATVQHAFVSLDSIAVDPHFAAAREAGRIDNQELDEAMLIAGLRAAGRNLPFEVTRAGIESDAVTRNPRFKTIASPYGDGEVLLAMPAIHLDLALLHMDRADDRGNAQLLGPDPFFDDLLARAATTCVVSAEAITDTATMVSEHPIQTMLLNRSEVTYTVELPGGAGFTSCEPLYGRDEDAQLAYAAAAGSEALWESWLADFQTAGGAR